MEGLTKAQAVELFHIDTEARRLPASDAPSEASGLHLRSGTFAKGFVTILNDLAVIETHMGAL